MAVGTVFRPSVTKRGPRNHWSCSCTVFVVPKTKGTTELGSRSRSSHVWSEEARKQSSVRVHEDEPTGNTERCKKWRTGMRVRHGERQRRHNLRGSTLVRASSKDDARGNWGAKEARIDRDVLGSQTRSIGHAMMRTRGLRSGSERRFGVGTARRQGHQRWSRAMDSSRARSGEIWRTTRFRTTPITEAHSSS